ncbi:MAG: hypothetical protein QF886_14800, partial [Planctomycetota bacterium]|nr:hypothetical protein [Planctomycetota bacterium]
MKYLITHILLSTALGAEGPGLLRKIEDPLDEQPPHYEVKTPLYQAAISDKGRITSLRLGKFELLDGDIRIGMQNGSDRVDEI